MLGVGGVHHDQIIAGDFIFANTGTPQMFVSQTLLTDGFV